MRFLKTMFWLVVAIVVTLFAAQNWRDVTIDLWGNLQADVKVPVLLAIVFLLGFLPTWLIYRGKLWRVQNRVTMPQRSAPRQRPETESEPAK